MVSGDEPIDRTVTLAGDDEVLVTVGPGRPGRDDDFVDFAVRISGRGLHAATTVVDLRGDFASFVREVAADWRGEHGDRRWESVERDLTVEANRPVSGGPVYLVFTLYGGDRPWEAAGWSATATVQLEAGAEMAAVADAIQAALTPAQ